MKKLLQFWLAFFQFNVVEGEVGATEEAVVENPAPTATEESAPEISPAEAVLEEMGLAEGSDGPKAEAPEAATETTVEEGISEGATTEQKPKEITADDLAPLNSRNPVANERFQKITEGYKQEKEKAEKLQAEVEQYRGTFDSLRQLGFNDQAAATDLVNFSQYRQAIYSGDAKTFEAIIAEQIRQFEAAHGKRVEIRASLLDMHDDLRSRVENLDLDEDTALEVARARTLQERAMRSQQAQYQNMQQAQQTQMMLDQSVDAVERLQANWAETDPDYQAILPHLQPQMQEIGANYPPSMWPKMIDLQYKTLKKALSESRLTQQRQQQQPLRGNGFGGAKPVASSPQQAVLQAMGLSE